MAHPFPEELALARQQANDQAAALRALTIPATQSLEPGPRAIFSGDLAPLEPAPGIDPPTGDPAWWSISEIATAYRAGTATPVTLVDAALARIDQLEPRLNAFVQLCAEDARLAAQSPDLPRRPLYGVPVAIKDVIDVAGMPTTCHSRLRLDRIALADAPVVARLRAAGAIILGKLATHEFAIGGPAFDLPFPPARNPWNTSCHPGGSSSGAGAAVAAGLVPLALGTDTAGSVRNPASACGIVGLKPTRGLLSCEGVVPLAWSLDHVGLLTRSVADMAVGLSLFAPPQRAVKGPRIGYIRHFHTADMPATPEMAAALDRVAVVLAAEECTLPSLNDFALVNRVILQCEGAAYHADNLRDRPEWFSRRTRSALQAGLYASAADYLRARRAQAMLSEAVEALFARYDVLVSASSMTPACAIDDDASIDTTYMMQARSVFNLSGHPALAMMAGLSSDGLPLSVQFASRHGDEATLLAVAARWERAMGGPQRPPI